MLNLNMRETDKHFLWSLLGAMGIILFWRGIWNGIDSLEGIQHWGWITHPSVSLFLGLSILTFSGLIFRDDPLGGIEKGVMDVLHKIQFHPEKKHISVTYHDKLTKKDVHIRAEDIKQIDKNMLLVHSEGKESFVPIHRIKSIHKNNKVIWRM